MLNIFFFINLSNLFCKWSKYGKMNTSRTWKWQRFSVIKPTSFILWLSFVLFLSLESTRCRQSHALGMENGEIKDHQITASSFSDNFQPWQGRLNKDTYWASAGSPTDPWIQVTISHQTIVTGIISQGSGEDTQWVKYLHIEFGSSRNQSEYIMEKNNKKVS